jgi:competence ComEA-like helix-hairpin-helix protein
MRLVLTLIAWAIVCSSPLIADELQKIERCKLVPADWADGDSFWVEFPDGRRYALRLYAVDCLELHVNDKTDASRQREQLRYFGISNFGGSREASIQKARELAESAAKMVPQKLKDEFTVFTAFADGGGDGRHNRIYAYVQTKDGKDLGELLLKSGHCRAYGVYRTRPDGTSRETYKQQLADLEDQAMLLRKGIWKFTDPTQLPNERQVQRQEDQALEEHLDRDHDLPAARSINPNTASRDELIRLPGIGEKLANFIIEERESGTFASPSDLLRVPGIGAAKLSKMVEYLRFDK